MGMMFGQSVVVGRKIGIRRQASKLFESPAQRESLKNHYTKCRPFCFDCWQGEQKSGLEVFLQPSGSSLNPRLASIIGL
jgi:hypothetical protein